MEQNTWIGVVTAIGAVIFVLFSGTNSAVKNLEAEVMAIHDEAMVEMAEMNRVGRALKRILRTLPTSSPRADSINAVLHQMKKAENDMYTWMRQYSPPTEYLPEEQALRYLEEQKRLIAQNQQDIRNARDAAKQLLQIQQ
ncbi:MAG: hypothetical protein NZM43_01235 [Saprospiraceae bacterium]|nr:hypothetical protein [Saprospiraceae bacterium]MDW8482923.1 hypothetical protein [Saprospiraceae bacterium]